MNSTSFIERVGKIKKPIRILILVGTIFVLAGLYIWLFYIPKTEEISGTKREIAGLKQQLKRVRIRAQNLERFEAEYKEVDIQFKEALKLLPNKKEIPTLLRTITQLGSDSQLEFRLFSPQRERPKDFYMEIPVSIEVSGNYHNLAVFFDKVGHMERIVNILNVSVKPVKERSTTLITKCDAVTYRFKGESHVKPAEDGKK